MCMSVMKCRMICPGGLVLDPREKCACVDQSIVDDLYQCDNLDSDIDFVVETKPATLKTDYWKPQSSTYERFSRF